MASPVDFFGNNAQLRPAPGDEDRVGVLPSFHGGQSYISCWKLSPEELAEVVRTGEVWIEVSAKQHPPINVSGLPRMEARGEDGQSIPGYYKTDGSHYVAQAEHTAVEAHGDQRYASFPYRYHLLAVVREVEKHTSDPHTLAAAWLHDTAEDTNITLEDLRLLATAETYRAVAVCTNPKEGTREEHHTLLLARLADDERGALVKCCDRTCNMRACALELELAMEAGLTDPRVARLTQTYVNEGFSLGDALKQLPLPPEAIAEYETTHGILILTLRSYNEQYPN